jgi:hypothetical protein
MPDGLPLPGYAIPYAFSSSEIQDFFATYSTDPVVSNYLFTKQPPYGVIFSPPQGYGQLLLWFDESGVFHVIDVTNMSIARQVQKAPYESPDASVINNIIEEIKALLAKLPSPQQAFNVAEIALAVAALYFVSQIVRTR